GQIDDLVSCLNGFMQLSVIGKSVGVALDNLNSSPAPRVVEQVPDPPATCAGKTPQFLTLNLAPDRFEEIVQRVARFHITLPHSTSRSPNIGLDRAVRNLA